MRATLLNHRYYPYYGGSERYIQKIAEWFAGASWSTQIVTTDAFDLEYFWDGSHQRVDAPAEEILNGVHVHRLPVGHSAASSIRFHIGRRGMGELSRILRWSRLFNEMAEQLVDIRDLDGVLNALPAPDVVVGANLGLEGMALAGDRLAARSDAAFVLLPFAHMGSSDDEVARRFISMPHQVRLVRRADMVVALTHAEAELHESNGARPDRIVVAGAGVDELLLDRASLESGRPPTEDPFTVVSIGAMAVEKGTVALVQASQLLASRGVQHRLILIGPELSSFRMWFERSGATKCDWIEKRGVVTEEEKNRLLGISDAFVLASRTESFGIVYLEAWSFGLPVVAAEGGAVSEVVSDEKDGILVPFGDPEAIANALERLATNRRAAAAFGREGYAKVKRHFLWPHVLERIESGMSRILGIEVSGR